MQVDSKKKAKGVKQPFIHSLLVTPILQFSYMMLISSGQMSEKNGLKAYAQSPQILPKGLPQDICLLMLKDPDGNFVEIVGPKTKSLK